MWKREEKTLYCKSLCRKCWQERRCQVSYLMLVCSALPKLNLLAWCLSNLQDEVSNKLHLPLVPWDSHQINQGKLSPKRFVWGSGLMNELIAKATQFGTALAVFSLYMWHPDEYISDHLHLMQSSYVWKTYLLKLYTDSVQCCEIVVDRIYQNRAHEGKICKIAALSLLDTMVTDKQITQRSN